MKFDTNLNLSPVYVDEDLMRRHGACEFALDEYRDLFGEGTKLPVTRNNFVNAGSDTHWLSGHWLGERFLSESDQKKASDRWWNDYTGRSLAYFQWPYVRRELKRRFPEWYAARAAR